MKKFSGTVTSALCAFLLAAGPLALEDRPWKVVLWGGLVAAAAYVKGRIDPSPKDD